MNCLLLPDELFFTAELKIDEKVNKYIGVDSLWMETMRKYTRPDYKIIYICNERYNMNKSDL